MGLYDREYASDDQQPGFNMGRQRMMVTNIALVTAAIYLVDILFTNGQLGQYMALHLDAVVRPWKLYQLLTCGFAHDPNDFKHVLFNMLSFWFLGQMVERVYGGKALLKFYLSTIVLGSLVWLVTDYVGMKGWDVPADLLARHSLLGASGAVTGVIVIAILLDPKRTVLLMMVIPAPMWVLGLILIVSNVAITFDEDSQVAVIVHFAGAVCGFIYYRYQWDLSKLVPGNLSIGALKPKPNLRVHDPDAGADAKEEKMAHELDRILAKIKLEGEDSLTRKERRTLQQASKKYQQRRDP